MPAHDLRRFILEAVEGHPTDLVAHAGAHFGISRQAVHQHLARLLTQGLVRAEGRTRARRYELAPLAELGAAIEGDSPAHWKRSFLPALAGVPASVVEIARFGFTEVVRNALEHSGAREVSVRIRRTGAAVEMRVSDQGAGIFGRLEAFEVAMSRSVALVARAFDTFLVWSDRRVLRRAGGSWSLEPLAARVRGTTVGMRIRVASESTIEKVLSRTHAEIPVRLAFEGAEQPTSREQARRLLARTASPGEVVLDFDGIACVGPAFADELLCKSPGLRLSWIRASPAVETVLRSTRVVGSRT